MGSPEQKAGEEMDSKTIKLCMYFVVLVGCKANQNQTGVANTVKYVVQTLPGDQRLEVTVNNRFSPEPGNTWTLKSKNETLTFSSFDMHAIRLADPHRATSLEFLARSYYSMSYQRIFRSTEGWQAAVGSNDSDASHAVYATSGMLKHGDLWILVQYSHVGLPDLINLGWREDLLGAIKEIAAVLDSVRIPPGAGTE